MRVGKKRPTLLVEIESLGTVDPFSLDLTEYPAGSGALFVRREGVHVPATLAGLNLVGAAQALFDLSSRWLHAAKADDDEPAPGLKGEVHLAIRQRDARLLAALLRRHVRRLPEPPAWMPELLRALEEIQVFLRWEAPG